MKKNKHKWIKDQPDFIALVSGTVNNLCEEVRLKCKCGKWKYKIVKRLGRIKII